MKKILLLLILATIVFSLNIQAQQRLWGTYYGGAGSEGFIGAAIDNSGNVLVASTEGVNSKVVKYNSSGMYQWGASIPNYYIYDIAVDNNGNSFATGYFGNANMEVFLTKINSAGAIQWSIIFGGPGHDFGQAVCCDPNGNIFIGGYTYSNSGIASNGFQNVKAGLYDGFLAKYNTNGTLVWSSYYGGPDDDFVWDLVSDSQGNIYAGGYSTSTSGISFNGHQNVSGQPGYEQAFLVKFDNNCNRLWGTYYGGANSERGYGLAVDNSNNIFFTGFTYGSPNNLAFNGFQNAPGGARDGFLVKFNAGGVRQWGTYYGNTGDDYGYSIATDNQKNVFLSGYTSSSSGISSVGSHQATYGGGVDDAYLVKFDSTGARLYCTYYGGSLQDDGYVVRTDNVNSKIYLGGFTASSNNISYNGQQNSNGGPTDGFLVQFDNPCLIPTQPGAISGLNSICENTNNTYSVTAVNGATSYTWTLPGGWSGTSVTNSISATAGVNSGTISVTANNACGSSAAQTLVVQVINAPLQPIVINGANSICENSTNTYAIAAVNGTVSYTWTLPNGWSGTSISNSINTTANATSGNITVTATNSCGTSPTQTLAVAVHPIYTTNTTAAICQGDSILLAGTYKKVSGTYTDNLQSIKGCDSIVVTTLTVNPLPTVSLPNLNAVCADAAAFALTGGLPAGGTYSGVGVNNNQFDAAVAGAGTHTITYTYTDGNTGCSNSGTNTIVVNPLPPTPIITVNGNTFTSSAASGNQWYLNGNPINGATNQTFVCTVNGNYTVCVTDANGCKSCSAVLNFTTIGISENKNGNEIIVYPNPFSGEVTLSISTSSISKGEAQANIYNTLGEAVYSTQLTAQPLTINLQEVPTGVYFLQVKNENGILTKKIIKQ